MTEAAVRHKEMAGHVVLPIDGMTCASCVTRVEKALDALPGVRASVNLSNETADVRFHPTPVVATDLTNANTRAGYDLRHQHRPPRDLGLTCAPARGAVRKGP